MLVVRIAGCWISVRSSSVLGPLEAELREREPERGVGALEDLARGARRLADVAPHADFLGALPGKEQREHPAHSSSVWMTSRPR